MKVDRHQVRKQTFLKKKKKKISFNYPFAKYYVIVSNQSIYCQMKKTLRWIILYTFGSLMTLTKLDVMFNNKIEII
jgi:hypothetical protein